MRLSVLRGYVSRLLARRQQKLTSQYHPALQALREALRASPQVPLSRDLPDPGNRIPTSTVALQGQPLKGTPATPLRSTMTQPLFQILRLSDGAVVASEFTSKADAKFWLTQNFSNRSRAYEIVQYA